MTVLFGLWLLALSCSCISAICSFSVPTVASTCSPLRLLVLILVAALLTPLALSLLVGSPAAMRSSSLACVIAALLSACASKMA